MTYLEGLRMTPFQGRCMCCGTDYSSPEGITAHAACRQKSRRERLAAIVFRSEVRRRVDRAVDVTSKEGLL